MQQSFLRQHRRAVAELLSATRIRDRATSRAPSESSTRVRRGGDAALTALRARARRPRPDRSKCRGAAWEAEVADAWHAIVRTAIARRRVTFDRCRSGRSRKAGAITVAPGITVEQRVVPLSRVGCYVPAGRYPLPSSLLMTAIPARVAGVGEVVVCCPRPDAAVFAAAIEAGVDRLFRIGGAQAIAAMAYGTATVPRVDKIVGPGNRWVSAAKSLVSADCGIDFYAGPTEILIVTVVGSGAAGSRPICWRRPSTIPMRGR